MSLKSYNKPRSFTSIPSQFYFYDKKSPTITSEVGIMPLTIHHELAYQNPETLLNGEAICDIIRECTNIDIDPKQLLKIDVDFLLTAIKSCTNGDIETYELECPSCGNKNTYTNDLTKMMSQVEFLQSSEHFVEHVISYPDATTTKFKVYLRPSTFEETLATEHSSFDDQKSLYEVNNKMKDVFERESLSDDEESEIYSDMFKILASMTHKLVDMFSNNVIKVEVFNNDTNELIETETDKEEIKEWINTIDKDFYVKIKDVISNLNARSISDVIDITCVEEECQHNWKVPFEVNKTDFFAKGS